MNKIKIDTENCEYLLNGKSIKGLKEITIKITTDSVPEVTLTMNSELDIKLDKCELSDF